MAGAAGDNTLILIFGLVLSIGLMGIVSVAVAQLLQRHRWIAYLGVLVIAYVASDMIYEGGIEVISALADG